MKRNNNELSSFYESNNGIETTWLCRKVDLKSGLRCDSFSPRNSKPINHAELNTVKHSPKPLGGVFHVSPRQPLTLEKNGKQSEGHLFPTRYLRRKPEFLLEVVCSRTAKNCSSPSSLYIHLDFFQIFAQCAEKLKGLRALSISIWFIQKNLRYQIT